MKKLIVLSGAGISADSGVPTFRSQNGLWMNHSIDKVCNYLTWKDNREMVHGFYNNLRNLLSNVEPNPAHRMVADWQKTYGGQCVNLTANVDDLFERAGCASTVHLHGFLPNMQCTACGNVFSIGYGSWYPNEDSCPKCSSKKGVKPGIVFFNEGAPLYSKLDKEFRGLSKEDTVMIIGTSGNVINVDALLFDKPCFKILNNLGPEPCINEEMYDAVHFCSATDAVTDLDKIVKDRMQ